MKTFLVCLLAAVVLAVSCRRQKLEEPYRILAHVPVSIDWTKSLLDLKQVGNVSLYFYPHDGSEPIIKVSDDLYYNLIELPVGEYSVIIFNDMINNVVGVSYSNESDFDRFSVNIIEKNGYKPPFYNVEADEVVVASHSRMAGWAMGEFVVDESLVEYTRSEEFKDYIAAVKSKAEAQKIKDNAASKSSTRIPMPNCNVEITKASEEALQELSNVVTHPTSTVINYRVRVKNLNSAMQFGVIMKGCARGTYLATDENRASKKRSLYDLVVRNREYDDPKKGIDGYVNFSLNTYGRAPIDEKYELSFRIVLQTGELVEIEREITEQMVQQRGHVIEIELEGEDELELPKNPNAGFDVNDWDDDIIIDL